jgi:signal transduction histidine kinase
VNEAAIPHEHFALFREKLGLTDEVLDCLDPHRDAFLAEGESFADRLNEVLSSMPESRRVLELMEANGGHRTSWIAWYRGLLTQKLSRSFESALWRSGIRHVSRNVNQCAVHLAYCTARLFLTELTDRLVPGDQRALVSRTLSQMIDLCLMVETDAFLAGTSQCDREVINGVAHQVRNPVAVIGGFARKLQEKTESGSAAHGLLSGMYGEARRLERMVDDVGAFIEIDQRPPNFAPCLLGEVFSSAAERLQREGWAAHELIELPPGTRAFVLDSDRFFLEQMFYHLLQNALEASADTEDRRIRVSTRPRGEPPALLAVEISNAGRAPTEEERQHLFAPFYSSKPTGSGFGLPISALVARKTHGTLDLAAVPGEGVRVTVTLPLLRGSGAAFKR